MPFSPLFYAWRCVDVSKIILPSFKDVQRLWRDFFPKEWRTTTINDSYTVTHYCFRDIDGYKNAEKLGVPGIVLSWVIKFFCLYYRKRGSASYIVREVLSVRERERERYRDTRKWRHHCRAKIGDEFTLSLAKNSHKWRRIYTFPCQKFALFVSPFTLSVSPFLNGHHCGAEFCNEFTLPLPKNFSLLVRNLSNGASRATSDRKLKASL